MSACRADVERYKTCPNCGGRFECRSTGCWCFEVKLDESVRAALRDRYAGCLCPVCLHDYAADPPAQAGESVERDTTSARR